MARIAINDIQESQSFLTELNHTDVAMDQINGGLFFFPFFRLFRGRRFFNIRRNVTFTPRITLTFRR